MLRRDVAEGLDLWQRYLHSLGTEPKGSISNRESAGEMNILYEVLFAIAFGFQIVVVSIYFPRRLARVAQGMSSPGLDTQKPNKRAPFQTYATLNNTIASVGLMVLVLCLALQFHGFMTGQLLCIGLFFLIQISTIVVPFGHGVLPIQRLEPSWDHLSIEPPSETIRLFNILPPVPVGIAVFLYISFVVGVWFHWDRFERSQLPKVAALTFTNLVFAVTILWNYIKFKKSAAKQASERYRELTRMAPIIIFGSILVTTYFFMKEIMFGLELHELRPTMMSVFLQLIAVTVFHALWRVDSILPGPGVARPPGGRGT